MTVFASLLLSLLLAAGTTLPVDSASTKRDSLDVRTGALPAAKPKKWTLTEDTVSLGLSGVSPHVMKTPSGDRLWRSDQVPSGTAVTMCDSAGVCTAETLSTGATGPISDYTIAQAKSGWRAYFKKVDMVSQTQGVYSAPCATDECLSFGTATLTSSMMVVPQATRAWGVPDPVRLPDGRIRIYIVESPASTSESCPEKVASYISEDGVTFTKEKGWRLTGGFVDTEVLRAKKNKWVMIVADGPGCGGTKESPKPQQLYITTSKNGLKWKKPKALTGVDVGRLDPTGYEISPNVFRIYYAAGSITENNYTIMRATLRFK